MRGTSTPLSSRGTAGSLQHSLSQIFSPTSYVPSPKATMPVPLLAALPLSPQLVLAPLALLSSSAALTQHPARRVVLLFSPSSICLAPQPAAAAGGGGLSPASPAAASSWDTSPVGSRGYGSGAESAAPATGTFTANPIFSPGGSPQTAGPTSAGLGPRSSGRMLSGTPRIALRFASPAIHPDPDPDDAGTAGTAASPSGQLPFGTPVAAAAGGTASPVRSPVRPLLGASRVHPESPAAALTGSGGRRQQPHGAPSIPPLGQPSPGAGAAAGHGTTGSPQSSRAGSEEAALLLRVLHDSELTAATAACNAAGVECRLAQVRTAGAERGMQQPLALAQWLTEQALPLLHGSSLGSSSSGGSQPGSAQRLPVLLAVQAGCEAEGAMAAVAHIMQQRQVSLYHAMVAASQWGIDLHLRQHHLLALQHCAASDALKLAPASARAPGSGRGSGVRFA